MDLNLPSAEQIALRINNQIATEMKVRPQQIGMAIQRQQGSSAPVGNTAFAEAFAKLKAKN
jgi:uncharacterized protein